MFPITNDAVVLGILLSVLALVYVSAQQKSGFWKKFYAVVPPLLLCYFIPALLHEPLGVLDPEQSQLYFVASRYLLPASLILLCLNVDLKGIMNLGPKALIIFLVGSLGIVLGGPIALFLVTNLFPSLITVQSEELWRGLSTIAGSWIGGSANQTAMKEIYQVSNELFAVMVVIDVAVAYLWMGVLLYAANHSKKIDRWLRADDTAIEALKTKMEAQRANSQQIPSTTSLFILLGVTFGGTALSHFGADAIMPWLKSMEPQLTNLGLSSIISSFFWLVVIATTVGVLLSFTKAKQLESVGASQWGTIFIYILVATIGMQMNLKEVAANLGLFVVGIIWMSVHIILLIVVAILIKAPFFYVAVGSQANVGGAASAPVVASAFSPVLAPVGVLLAVLGYALGTYGGILCAYLMEMVVK
jgi:uncharacterized membrane protein